MSDRSKLKKAVCAAKTSCRGHSQAAYHPRNTIAAGLNLPGSRQHDESSVCQQCLDPRDILNSFVHAGRDLKRRKTGYPSSKYATYRNVEQQNEYLLKTVPVSLWLYPMSLRRWHPATTSPSEGCLTTKLLSFHRSCKGASTSLRRRDTT